MSDDDAKVAHTKVEALHLMLEEHGRAEYERGRRAGLEEAWAIMLASDQITDSVTALCEVRRALMERRYHHKEQAPQSPEGPAEATSAVTESAPKDVSTADGPAPSVASILPGTYADWVRAAKEQGTGVPMGPDVSTADPVLKEFEEKDLGDDILASGGPVQVINPRLTVGGMREALARERRAIIVLRKERDKLRGIVEALAAYHWMGAWCPFCKCSLYGEPKHADDCIWCRAREATR